MRNNIDLSKLIDEVLRMAQESHEQRMYERRHAPSEYEIYQRELQKASNLSEAELRKQRLVNLGMTDVRDISETGQTTRQRLGDISRENVANIGAGASRYVADVGAGTSRYVADVGRGSALDVAKVGLTGSGLTAGATVRAAEIANEPRAKLLEAWGKGLDPTEESLKTLQKGYNTLYPEPRKEVIAPGPGAWNEFDIPDQPARLAPITTPSRRTTPPIGRQSVFPAPMTQFSKTKPAPVVRQPHPLTPIFEKNAAASKKKREEEEASAAMFWSGRRDWLKSKFPKPGPYYVPTRRR